MTDLQPLSILRPLKRNPKRETKRGHDLLHTSLEDGGAGRSVLIDNENTILAGNSTFEAFGQLVDNPKVLIVETDGDVLIAHKRRDIPNASDPKAQALIIGDNRASDFHEYDPTILADYDADIVGNYWFEEELEALGGYESPVLEDTPPDMSRADELQIKWQVERGQVWQVGKHRVMCGDCTSAEDVARLMGGVVADCVIADPPYGMNLDASFSNSTPNPAKGMKASKGYTQIIGDDQPFDRSTISIDAKEEFWFGGDYYIDTLPSCGKNGSWLVWDKRATLEDLDYSSSSFELCWTKQKHKREIMRVAWFGLIGTEKQDIKKRVHPTQKPLDVIKWIVEKYSKPDDIIVDPFLGSGTTMVAAEMLSRVCYGIEIWPAYCSVTLERLSTLGLEPRLVNGA